jgi:hypothetical protein
MLKKVIQKEDERKVRSDKKTRVNASLDEDTHRKLKKLSVSCNMTKTMLASEIIKLCVNHTEFIKFFQDKYNTEPDYRVIPVKVNGKVTY